MRREWRGIAASFLALSAAAACNRGSASGSPTVALVVKTLNNPFFIEMEKGARAAADSLKIPLVVQAPEREIDVEKQMQIVENLIQDQVKVLVLVPSGSREIVPSILKANAAKIPVVVVDTRVDSAALQQARGQVATFIGSDNVDGGRIAGEFVAESSVEWGTSRCSKGFRGTRRATRGYADSARRWRSIRG